MLLANHIQLSTLISGASFAVCCWV